MSKKLMILEISQKQSYIFASKRLKDNADRSLQIREVTESSFFQEIVPSYYSEADNLVYSGGGHTVLQFSDEKVAVSFAKKVSSEVLHRYPDMELYIKQIDYDPKKRPKQNLNDLSSALEKKKARRAAAFRWQSLGVEELDREFWVPKHDNTPIISPCLMQQVSPPDGTKFPREFDQLRLIDSKTAQRASSFIAVVHIDGNAMGRRVEKLLDKAADWDEACSLLRRFSSGVDEDFTGAFQETVDRLLQCKPELKGQEYLPIRPIILAGDDVCFVTAGSLGLECAQMFLEALSSKINAGDRKGYAACAGVALVHYKYPFHMAYNLAEELCSSAKRFGQSLDTDGQISAMDWHIEFGQLKDGLREIREDYNTEDGNRLELRPVTVIVPENTSLPENMAVRSYAYFRSLCGALHGEYGKIARGKLKDLRTALKQGETETRFYLADRQVSDLLYHPFDARYQNADAYHRALKRIMTWRVSEAKEAFTAPDDTGIKRSLFFDALEMIDHFEALEEVTEP